MADLVRSKAIAYKLNQVLAITNPQEIVLEDIAMSRGVLVIEGPLEGADARLVRQGDKGLIRVKPELVRTGRGRFALAHELGHWELHRGDTQWQFCSEKDLCDYAKSDLEIEANTFASEFLMPTVLFRPKCQDAIPDLNLVKQLAEEFKVSLTAAAVRFAEETNRACVIIFSENGQVSWWKKSLKCESVWIERNQEIKEGSLAWDRIQDGITEPADKELVDPEAWFDREGIGEVYEQSIKLGRYPTVLTLLWLP